MSTVSIGGIVEIVIILKGNGRFTAEHVSMRLIHLMNASQDTVTIVVNVVITVASMNTMTIFIVIINWYTVNINIRN